MKIEIIGTGSSGNAFLFDDCIMIDAGLPYAKIKHIKDSIEYILLTHEHGDHFNRDTVRKMFVNSKAIFVCGEWMVRHLLNIGIDSERIRSISATFVYSLKTGHTISPVILYHDVPNFGYRIKKEGHKHFHATDTERLDGITAINYDTATIECNHDETRALELISEAKENEVFSHLDGAMNSHLSVQQTLEFCRKNNIGELIPVHIGKSTHNEVIKAINDQKRTAE